MARDFSEAVNGYRDGWGPKCAELWLRESHELEDFARVTLGDEIVASVFDRVGVDLGDQVWRGIESYFERLARKRAEYDVAGTFRAVRSMLSST